MDKTPTIPSIGYWKFYRLHLLTKKRWECYTPTQMTKNEFFDYLCRANQNSGINWVYIATDTIPDLEKYPDKEIKK